MKRILFVAAFATLLAAGCQKTEIINHVPGDAMTFSTGMGKLTKASEATPNPDATFDGNVNLQAQDFRVWAYYAADDPNTVGAVANGIYDNINGITVGYTDPAEGADKGTWTTTTDYYWPGVGKALKFFAVSAPGQTVEVKAAEATVTVGPYTIDPLTPNVDIMVADFVQQSQEDSKEVALNFHHTFAKVEFCFQTTAQTTENVFVQSLVVEDLKNVGTLGVTATETVAGTQTTVLPKWGETSGEVDFTDDWTTVATAEAGFPADYTPAKPLPEGETLVVDNTAMRLNAIDEADVFTTWLMMPQTISNKQVSITYLINNRQFVSVFPLYTDSLTEWAENQYIKYTITLSPYKISFVPDVKDWAPVDGNNVEMEN